MRNYTKYVQNQQPLPNIALQEIHALHVVYMHVCLLYPATWAGVTQTKPIQLEDRFGLD